MHDTRHEEITNLEKSQDITKFIVILLLRKLCTKVSEVIWLIKIVPKGVTPAAEQPIFFKVQPPLASGEEF